MVSTPPQNRVVAYSRRACVATDLERCSGVFRHQVFREWDPSDTPMACGTTGPTWRRPPGGACFACLTQSYGRVGRPQGICMAT